MTTFSGICRGGPMDGRKLAASLDHRAFMEPPKFKPAEITADGPVSTAPQETEPPRVAGTYRWHYADKAWDWHKA